MTHLLVRVLDAREAAQAAVAGIDAVELVLSHDPDIAAAHAVRTAFPGLLRLRFAGAGVTAALVSAATTIRADEVALPLDATPPAFFDVVPGPHPRPIAILSSAILSATDHLEAIARVREHVGSVMLDAGDLSRLIDTAPIAALDAFACACRASGLAFGLAGGLEAPDVARLLLLRPDVLAFDTAVRRHHSADGPLDTAALDAIRALIPWAGSAPPGPSSVAKVADKIFVRDFEVSLAIGAYQAEHGTRQRVRFSVVADVLRAPTPPHDMRDVFSYDIIIETIRVLAERPHVTFVETLAEEVAASILTQADVVAVSVKVEKLDVISGAVGIEILRRRDVP